MMESGTAILICLSNQPRLIQAIYCCNAQAFALPVWDLVIETNTVLVHYNTYFQALLLPGGAAQ